MGREPARRPKSTSFTLIFLLAFCLGAAGCVRRAPAGHTPADYPPPSPPEPQLTCPLCGRPAPEARVKRRPLAIVVDNAPQARPQSGLDQACLVYELLAEGGVTRFLAFFLHEDPPRVGPVRSLRPYFLDLVLPWDAALGHAGGSEQALAERRSLGVKSLDEIYGGGDAYWRVPPSERRPPHATYTSGERFREALRKRKWEDASSLSSAFTFTEKLPGEGEDVQRVTVTYPGGYRVTYAYDTASGNWLRFLGDQPHRDDGGKQLEARNLLVQFVPMRPIPGDKLLHMEARMTGRGRTLVFSGGKGREAEWEKESRRSPFTYREQDAGELRLLPGPTWVLVVPPDAGVQTR